MFDFNIDIQITDNKIESIRFSKQIIAAPKSELLNMHQGLKTLLRIKECEGCTISVAFYSMFFFLPKIFVFSPKSPEDLLEEMFGIK